MATEEGKGRMLAGDCNSSFLLKDGEDSNGRGVK
jgi:hypothetical protein